MRTKKVIIYRLGSLGDTVAALPCFHLIERSFPDAERIVLTNVPVSTKAAPLELILRDGGFVSRSIAYPYQLRDPRALSRLASALRAEEADALIYLLGASRSLAAVWRDVAFFRLCGLRRIIGAPLTRSAHRVRFDAEGDQEQESHRLGRALTSLGKIDFSDRSWWDLRLTHNEHRNAVTALSSLNNIPFLAVNTGGKAQQKDWGASNWRQLLEALSSRFDECGLVFVGAPDDRARAAELASSWSNPATLDLCGRLDPRSSGAALQRAAIFIGHDSGPFHLADAVGTPAIGLFGDYNHPKKWYPSGKTTRVIHSLHGIHTINPHEVAAEASVLADYAWRT